MESINQQQASELIASIHMLVSALQQPRKIVPLDKQLWAGGDAAEFLGVSERHFLERISAHPDFPRPILLPTSGGTNRTRRWKASEVMRWADMQQERKRAS